MAFRNAVGLAFLGMDAGLARDLTDGDPTRRIPMTHMSAGLVGSVSWRWGT